MCSSCSPLAHGMHASCLNARERMYLLRCYEPPLADPPATAVPEAYVLAWLPSFRATSLLRGSGCMMAAPLLRLPFRRKRVLYMLRERRRQRTATSSMRGRCYRRWAAWRERCNFRRKGGT